MQCESKLKMANVNCRACNLPSRIHFRQRELFACDGSSRNSWSVVVAAVRGARWKQAVSGADELYVRRNRPENELTICSLHAGSNGALISVGMVTGDISVSPKTSCCSFGFAVNYQFLISRTGRVILPDLLDVGYIKRRGSQLQTDKKTNKQTHEHRIISIA